MTARFDSIADLHGSVPEIRRVDSGAATEVLAGLITEPWAVIVERWLGDEMLSHVNDEIDGWFARNIDDGPPASGSDLYDLSSVIEPCGCTAWPTNSRTPEPG